MNMSRECIASIVRMFLFCAIGGILAVLGDKDIEVLLSACFMLLGGNELVYVFGVLHDIKKQQMPKVRSRKKTKKVNPIRKYVVQLFIFEGVACCGYWILYANMESLPSGLLVVLVLVAAFLSVVF